MSLRDKPCQAHSKAPQSAREGACASQKANRAAAAQGLDPSVRSAYVTTKRLFPDTVATSA